MSKKAIVVTVDVECTANGIAPYYRAYLNDELFTERTWRFESHQYLEESWQIRAVPGRYQLRYELLGPGHIKTSNWQVLKGTASVDDQGRLVIHDA